MLLKPGVVFGFILTCFQLFKHCSAAIINSGFIWSLPVLNISPSSLKVLSQSVADDEIVNMLIANFESTGYSYHCHFVRTLFTVIRDCSTITILVGRATS